MAKPKSVSCGLDLSCAPNLSKSLANATSSRFSFICTYLIHPLFKREFLTGPAKNRSEPLTRPDLIVSCTDWTNLIIGKFSPFLNVDSANPVIRKNSEESLKQELTIASHLGLSAVTFKLKGNIDKNVNLARIICNKLETHCTFQAWVQIPLEDPIKQAYSYRKDCPMVEDPWDWWNAFRITCDYNRKLGIALIISPDLPSEEEIDRWLGEPVRCLIIPTTLFLTNKKGYPVLSKAHQWLIKRFVTMEVQVMLTGTMRYKSVNYYRVYIEHLWKTYEDDGLIQKFARGYEDYLQCPLQPLMDNLESQTYEIFEKDPVKYQEYQNAVYAAIKTIIPKIESENRKLVIMVLGAGRGPLVTASLNAAKMNRQAVKIYAIEKNPNAVITLQALERDIWEDKVTVVSCDMREWNAPEKADIIVSELLGSFGDNELSPECLDGALKFLRDGGINIPQSYTSHIAPIQSSKIYNEVRQCRDKDKNPLAHFEMSYVVHFQNKYDIARPEPLFTFHHPNQDIVADNSRYEIRSFPVTQNCVLHGFSGYFSSILYKDIKISIEPNTYSHDMFSWFPIFFPLKEPVQLMSGDEVVIHFWRRCSSKKVWYEWCLSKPVATSIHNLNGRAQIIGL